jgi:hypothetical protein
MVDEGGVVRDLDRPVARYHSPLVGVICQRDR